MCMLDDSGGWVTIINEGVYRTARKPHKCAECRRPIAIGESYHTEAFVHDGDFTVHKTCAHCMVLRGWLMKECHGFVYTMVVEDFDEHAESHGWRFHRLAMAARGRWSIGKGDRIQVLRHIPAMPPSTNDAKAS